MYINKIQINNIKNIIPIIKNCNLWFIQIENIFYEFQVIIYKYIDIIILKNPFQNKLTKNDLIG